jgi:hypothetical protein
MIGFRYNIMYRSCRCWRAIKVILKTCLGRIHMRLLFSVVCLCALASFRLTPTALAQGPGIVATTTSFHRAYAIVPLIGKGTHDDPSRPMFVPAEGLAARNQPSIVERNQPGFAKPRTGIVAFTAIPTDDGRAMIVEYVSMDRAGLREILESRAPGVQVFEAGRDSRGAIEAVFKARRKDFDFLRFQTKVR